MLLVKLFLFFMSFAIAGSTGSAIAVLLTIALAVLFWPRLVG